MTTLALSSLPDPITDPEFSLEREGARKEVFALWPVCMQLLAAKPRTGAMRSAAARLGTRFGTLREIFYTWLRSGGDWRVLINRAKWPEPDRATWPPAFVAFVVNVYESNQRERSAQKAHDALMARLSAWERSPFDSDLVIPGYDLPPRRSPYTHHPEGWSYRNICRLLEQHSDIYARTIRRIGAKRGSEFLPSIRTSRIDRDGNRLGFGQIFYFDDSQHDVYVNVTGRNGDARRPLSFNCLEALSGSLCHLALKPQLENLDGNGREELNQTDFFWFVMGHLMANGYNAKEGTLLVFEHRTANIDKSAQFDEMIARATGGKVHVDRSGKFGRPEFKGMLFEGQASGNFRFKAPIESFFQNVRNLSGWLPAPTGPSPDREREENYGLLVQNNALQRLIDKVDKDTFLRLKRDVLEWEDYARICYAIHHVIDGRRNHHLEGFRKLGFTRMFYRLALDAPWMGEAEYNLIPAEQREAYRHIVAKAGYHHSELMSPREVYKAHAHMLTRIGLGTVATLAPDRAWVPCTVSNGLEIVIKDQWVDSEPLVYWAKLQPMKGPGTITLERGGSYKYLLSPFNADHLLVADKAGACIGVASRVHAPVKLDYEAVIRQMAALNTLRADENVEVHSRLSSEAAHRVDVYHENRRLKEGQPPASRADQRRDKSAAEFGHVLARQPASPVIPQPEEQPEKW